MSFQSLVSNFALILFVLLVLTGSVWLLDVLVLAKQRRQKANDALAEFDKQLKSNAVERHNLELGIMRRPGWVEYTGSFFPVIALVFVLRSFLFEPFKIPSESMLPTLYVGDLILVNKFTYGIRLPIVGTKIIKINDPQRGDVMVFKYPEDPSLDYIKRVVGVPGDLIEYKNKRLTVNGNALSYEPQMEFLHEGRELKYSKQFVENLTGVEHRILNRDYSSDAVTPITQFPHIDSCHYDAEGVTCRVPAGNYFMMGDNRDNSMDSRYWGFVPDANIVGKAVFIWMNFSSLKRIGSFK